MKNSTRTALLRMGIQPIQTSKAGIVAGTNFKWEKREPIEHPAQRKQRGGYSELIACAWLIEQGYEVFRNVCDRGIIDLIAMRGGKVEFIDVKTLWVQKSSTTKRYSGTGLNLSAEQVAAGVRPLYVSPGGICDWDSRLLIAKLNGEI